MQVAPGVVLRCPFRFSDAAACATLTAGLPQVAVEALCDLDRLLSELDGNRSPLVVATQEKHRDAEIPDLPLPVPQLRLALPEPTLVATIPLSATTEWNELLRSVAEFLLEAAGMAEEAHHDDEG